MAYGFNILARPAGERIYRGRARRPWRQRLENILAGQWNGKAGAHHRIEKFVMIDLAKPWPAIFVFGNFAMIFNGESADVAPAGLNIGDRILVFVIEYVAGVIANGYARVSDFGDNAGAVLAGGRIASVLLDDD